MPMSSWRTPHALSCWRFSLGCFGFLLDRAAAIAILLLVQAGCGGNDDMGAQLSSPPIALPRTGQTQVYAPGDDGQTQRGTEWPSPRFSNLDGSTPPNESVVLDRLTGLVWTRNANAPGPSTCAPALAKTWYDALLYIECLNANRFLGIAQWRLPNRHELASLLNYGSPNWVGWAALQGLDSVQSVYWSSSHYGSDPQSTLRWQVEPLGVFGAFVANELGVWPVTGSSALLPKTGQTISYAQGDDGQSQSGVTWPSPRFVEPDAGDPARSAALVDALTGLMWPRDRNSPGPVACQPGERRNWASALDYVGCLNTLGYLGHSDWTLPNIVELESVLNINESNQSVWLATQGFANVQAPFTSWSSTTDAYAVLPFAWVIAADGTRGPSDKPNELPIWPVRRTR